MEVELARYDEGWKSRGACVGVDPDLFYPERGQSTQEAKAICRTCSVRLNCLDYAVREREIWGIWGGTSERERRVMRRRRKALFAEGRRDEGMDFIFGEDRKIREMEEAG